MQTKRGWQHAPGSTGSRKRASRAAARAAAVIHRRPTEHHSGPEAATLSGAGAAGLSAPAACGVARVRQAAAPRRHGALRSKGRRPHGSLLVAGGAAAARGGDELARAAAAAARAAADLRGGGRWLQVGVRALQCCAAYGFIHFLRERGSSSFEALQSAAGSTTTSLSSVCSAHLDAARVGGGAVADGGEAGGVHVHIGGAALGVHTRVGRLWVASGCAGGVSVQQVCVSVLSCWWGRP